MDQLDTVVVAEGLEVFRVPVPEGLVGRSLAQSALRDATGCTVIAVAHGDTLHHDVDVHDVERLVAGQRIDGPAIIDQPDGVIVVPPGAVARADRFDNVTITPDAGGAS